MKKLILLIAVTLTSLPAFASDYCVSHVSTTLGVHAEVECENEESFNTRPRLCLGISNPQCVDRVVADTQKTLAPKGYEFVASYFKTAELIGYSVFRKADPQENPNQKLCLVNRNGWTGGLSSPDRFYVDYSIDCADGAITALDHMEKKSDSFDAIQGYMKKMGYHLVSRIDAKDDPVASKLIFQEN